MLFQFHYVIVSVSLVLLCYFTCPFLKSPDHLSLCAHFYFTFFVRLYFNSALSLKKWVRFDVGSLHDSGILHFTSPINETIIESTIC